MTGLLLRPLPIVVALLCGLGGCGGRSYYSEIPEPEAPPRAAVVTLYALNVPTLDLKPDVGLAGFNRALEGKVLGKAAITGYYGR